MKKKAVISILELNYHAEVLQNMLDVVDTDSFQFRLITIPEIEQKLTIPNDIQLNVITKGFQEIESYTKHSDLLFFNTLATFQSKMIRLLQTKPNLVRVHNVNSFFSNQSIFPKPKNSLELWKFTSHFLRKELFGQHQRKKKLSLSKVESFIFPTTFLLREAKKNKPLWIDRFYPKPIPFSYQKQPQQVHAEKPTIIIPGRIDKRRKDYQFALSVLREIDSNCRVVLLGIPVGRYGKHIQQQFKQLPSFIEVVCFSDYIPPQNFNYWMKRATVLFLPIQQETSFTNSREFYGHTKVSGTINDAISWGLPFIIPAFYPLDIVFKNQAKIYQDKHEASLILNESLQENKRFRYAHLSKEALQKKYTDLFTQFFHNNYHV